MRFNTPRKTTATANHQGAEAFALTPQLELYTAVATTALADSFYEKDADRLTRIRALIAQNDPHFVAKLAVYAREKMHLRTVPVALAVELARTHSGNGLVATTVGRIVQRADEIAEVLAYYAQANGRTGTKQLGKLSKQVQKGLAAAFNKFDEYQFAKYNRDTSVKLRDALFLVHPKAKDEVQQAIFDRIVRGKLATPDTWEVALSRAGQEANADEAAKAKSKKASWESLIVERKLGYMALLRNLRNILEAGVSNEALTMACAYLSDARAVAGSKQLPFRFLSAYREVKAMGNVAAADTGHGWNTTATTGLNKLIALARGVVRGDTNHGGRNHADAQGRTGLVLEALETAVQHSAANIAGYGLETRVVIAADVSGSMQAAISPRSTVQRFDIGLMLAMLLQHRCKHVTVGMFGDTWKTIAVPKSNILGNVLEFHHREGEVGYSTNGYKVIDGLTARRQVADKVMMFTDCQLWNSTGTSDTIRTSWAMYKREVAPAAKLYLFDLAGHGTTPLSVLRDDVHLIAGWSDKVFDVLHAIDNGHNAVQVIEDLTLADG